MRILIVDDHDLFWESLGNLLLARGFEVVGVAADGLEALEQARQLQPELILMDIEMPHCDGLVATRLIKAEMPEIRIVMLTVSAQDEDLFEAIMSGAMGYFLKNMKASRFVGLLHEVERGEAVLSPGLAARVLTEFARQKGSSGYLPDGGKEVEGVLTPRQEEILMLVAGGMTYCQVGETLHLSERTIRYRMGEIIERLHLENRTQVIAYAVRTGLARDISTISGG